MTTTHALGLLIAYVCGSFPTAYLAGRLLKGVDLRARGSGNLGATNVYREIGWAAAIVVLAIDAVKGWIAVALVPSWLHVDASDAWPILFGGAAILGHAKPIFLLGRGGGKGVATGAGVFLALAPIALGVATAVFALVVVATRFVSAGSLAAAVVLPVAVALTGDVRTPVFIASIAVGVFVIWAHRANIRRLLDGNEKRIGRAGAGASR